MNVIISLVLIILFLKKVYKKLEKLIKFMKEVEKGIFDLTIVHSDNDEFGYIYNSFNRMVSRIKELFEKLYAQMVEQKNAELKLLQYKINPHFIYNIFDNMNWLIELGKYDELGELVGHVSSYYKRSLNVGKDFISIANTKKQLESYIEIQKIRFGDRFNSFINFDDSIKDICIPNFILQPIVENAICHGIEPKDEGGIVNIKGNKIADNIVFVVEDNGVGIKSDLLKKINDVLNTENDESCEYFAVSNINKRIKLFYGNSYGLSINSIEQEGTMVKIIIPFTAISNNGKSEFTLIQMK